MAGVERNGKENIFDCFHIINTQDSVHWGGGFEGFVAVGGGIVDGFAEARFQKRRTITSVK